MMSFFFPLLGTKDICTENPDCSENNDSNNFLFSGNFTNL